jgi:cytochrome P450
MDAIAAVTAPDPYPFYAELARRPPLHHDERLGMRIAARGDTIAAVLGSPLCAVRPAGQPVPPALVGTFAGEIFARLVRQNDGPRHAALRPATRVLADVAPARPAARLADIHELPHLARSWPARALAPLLGIDEDVSAAVDDLARAFAPGAPPDAVRRGDAAARALAAAVDAAPGGRLRAASLAAAPAPREVVIANLVGLLVQAHDATAGLIGGAALALARGAAHTADRAVSFAARHDPPVHNTRRFVLQDGVVAGVPVARGETILVVLAAAPGSGFGHGPHACPGEALARAMATAAAAAVLASGVELAPLRDGVRYRPSQNTRVIAEVTRTA